MKQISIFLLFTILSSCAFAQSDNSKLICSDLKKGTFKYLDIEDTTAYFELDKESHIEYHSNGKYYIKSKIKWINDCQYEMKMLSNTIPDFPFKPGAVMIVTIDKIESEIIYYTSEVKGESWKGRLVKLK